ncbi:MAG: crossover junction endodeoxyribonuclease RuvC [Cryobacterium sp.]|jgi:crossover junction endodeoxyribonuclease RuvC|nr:crossover junction endodeoxyribonuclease RuvC [Cryobacterium sp.]
MALRVFGVDPGLTRCGVGVVDVEANRTATLVAVEVIRTETDAPLEQRLLEIGAGIERMLDEYSPDAVALERVFAQQNLRTVMGVAQASGVVLLLSAQHGLAVGLHTPTEVKAALTGHGAADKKQLGAMVARILRLDAVPKPADASDALALAICHAWRSGIAAPSGSAALTPAQEAWRAAERSAGRTPGRPRLDP